MNLLAKRRMLKVKKPGWNYLMKVERIIAIAREQYMKWIENNIKQYQNKVKIVPFYKSVTIKWRKYYEVNMPIR